MRKRAETVLFQSSSSSSIQENPAINQPPRQAAIRGCADVLTGGPYRTSADCGRNTYNSAPMKVAKSRIHLRVSDFLRQYILEGETSLSSSTWRNGLQLRHESLCVLCQNEQISGSFYSRARTAKGPLKRAKKVDFTVLSFNCILQVRSATGPTWQWQHQQQQQQQHYVIYYLSFSFIIFGQDSPNPFFLLLCRSTRF